MLPEPTSRLRFRRLTMQDVEGHAHVEVGYHVMLAMRRHRYATEAATGVRDCLVTVALRRPRPAAIQSSTSPTRRYSAA